MYARVESPATSPRFRPFQAAGFALLFWIFTYILLSARTQMLLGDSFPLLSVRRLAAITAGALIYYAVLRWIERSGRERSSPDPLAILAMVLPASILVLALRLAVDHLVYQTPLTLQENVRWVMVWTGYFGMWVSASLAFQMHRAAEVSAKATTLAAPARPLVATVPGAADPKAWDWVVDACAAELEALPDADRFALADRLLSRAGYECADPLDPSSRAQPRIELAHRLAARLLADR